MNMILFNHTNELYEAESVYVEFSGQGARAAASIASLMIEKYLLGGTKRPQIEEYVLKGKFLN